METQSNAKLFGTFRLSAARFVATLCGLLATLVVSAAPLTIEVIGVGADGQPLAAPVTSYRWTVEEDATKLSIPGQPATTANYSFSFHTSYMPVVAAGRVGADGIASIKDPDVARLYSQQMPDLVSTKRYYVSIAAEGYQVGGAPVVFSADGGTATAKVYVNQHMVPTAQVSVFAFEDKAPLNGAPDLPVETGLAGFTVELYEAGGTYGQSGGQVTQDGFGNPLGTTYSDEFGTVKVRGKGIVRTGPDGTATIKNLFPAKYTVVIVPPVGSDWHQTSTIEGTRGSDAWVKNNEPSFFQEFGPPGHHVFIGFTKSGCVQGTSNGGRCVGLTGATARTITGRVINIHNSRPPQYNFEAGAPVPECWVGLNETTGDLRSLYTVPCDKASNFSIPNVPDGTYELVVWDDPLDMIMGTQTITVGGGNLAMGDVPVFSWFARYQGRVFQDLDGSGKPVFGPEGLPNNTHIEVDPATGLERVVNTPYAAGALKPSFGEGIANNIRFRDGSIYQSVTTKKDGTFAFTELFPFFNWMVAEIDYARFKATGATMVTDAGGKIDAAANATNLWPAQTGLYGSNDPAFAYNPWTRLNPQCQEFDTATPPNCIAYSRTENCAEGAGQCAILLEGMQTFLGETNHIEWGKQPYAINENGGIAGIVHYAITRAEDDPRFAAAENWEPGIPHVQVNLYLDCDADGKVDKPKNDGTGQCDPAGLSRNEYIADLADVDNYPFGWADGGAMGPEDVCRSAACKASSEPKVFSSGDVFRWGGAEVGIGHTDSWDDNLPDGCVANPALNTVTNGGVPVTPTSGLNASTCLDGLYNFNQIRPAVFDGGYAFGRVAGQPELPMLIGTGADGAAGKGTYIVEAVAPPGYLHQGNGDKNVVFGDALKASVAALPFECVGMELPVPAELTLFPGEPNPNAEAGQTTWRKCDMKAVPLVPGTNPAPDFHMFTEAPIAGHGVGFILDDTASEFNRFSPTFGEKYAPPHLPVSVQDWTGREISRVYSDQFGSYNFLTPSSYTINPPFPSGVMPSMMVSCMNHPGPIPVLDANGQPVIDTATNQPKMQIDPFFNRKYTQFCYTLQYLPGKTTYLDTPVLPIAAFAQVEKNPLDCECQDKTPAIYSANNSDPTYNNGNNGPWVPQNGGTLTIVSMGSAVQVPNPAYDPKATSGAATQKYITRDYGFGSTTGTVKLGATTLSLDGSWSADLLKVVVPSGTPTGQQLTITRAPADGGKESAVGLTVHVGGLASPIAVQPGASIQAVIDAAPAGSLISIPPGTYNEHLILDKRVRLQGWGAGSATINASNASSNGLAAWRKLLDKKVDARCSLVDGATPGQRPDFVAFPATGCPPTTPIDADTNGPTIVAGPPGTRTFDPLPGQTLGIDRANNEPLLFGAEEGAGILAVGKANGDGTSCQDLDIAMRIDGLTITGGDAGGGILASGYNCNLQITNNRVVANYGTYGGGIRVGHTALVDGDTYTDAVNNSVNIHHNWVSQNGASETAADLGAGGGITLGTGSDDYSVTSNYVCGNFSMSDGGGIAHVGRSGGTSRIASNKIILNQTFNQSADPTGGGLFIGGQSSLLTGVLEGTGDVNVDANLIEFNQAGAGAGGGVSIARTIADTGNSRSGNVVLTNNMIVNNMAAYAGGGVAVADVDGSVRLVNNTVADNISTATNRQSFPPGPKTQSTAQVAGIVKLNNSGSAASNPNLLNNIVWGNRSYTWRITPIDPNNPNVPQTTALGLATFGGQSGDGLGVWDLGRIGSTSHSTGLPSTNSVLTANAGNSTTTTNVIANATQVAFLKPITFLPQPDADQPVALPETTILQTALTFDEGGNFINVVYSPLTPFELANGSEMRADYHIKSGVSTAINAGQGGNGSNRVPTRDFDGDSRELASSGSAINVDIGADEVPPLPPIVLTAPAQGSTVGGTAVAMSATLNGLSNVNRVQFLVNGTVVATDTAATGGWTGAWNSRTTANGTVFVTARACGNASCSNVLATSAPVTVTVFNAPAGAASFNPDPVAFGNVCNAASCAATVATRTVTMTNAGNAPLSITAVAITASAGDRFTLQSQTCTATPVAINGTCLIVVGFNNGSSNTNRVGTLTLTDNGIGAHSVALSGN